MSLATISILALSFSNLVISNAMEKDINLKNEKNIRLENGDTISISGNTSTWKDKCFIDGRNYDFADVLSKYSGVFISQHM
ncbi:MULTISPECIES: hypothetical protein [unclassified Clostridioides]|uniref:hypothetical protein n=1 Tax=unclassified Clostridioides TaxID=2635829 RepID=UPI001D0FDF50|nr:hypothetical protein [Clostridioides sp. ES-S-0001-02]MCC0655554.1 hypothetical protein [Clostridioides sp. ES-S-0123-01]